MGALLLLHLAATLFMAGVIWFTQLVHYPLFAKVGAAGFPDYGLSNIRLTARLVLLPMAVEGACALLLLRQGPLAWLAAGLLALIWLSTAFLQFPTHLALIAGLTPELLRRLLLSNWLRTALWTLRAFIAGALAYGNLLE